MNTSDYDDYALGIIIFEFIVGFVGNIIACIVILCSRSMHTLTDFYLLSLSTADLLILVTGIYLEINRYVDTKGTWLYQLYESKVIFYTRDWISQTSVNASVLIVTAFTVERYLAICHPFLIQSTARPSRVKKIIATIWFTSAVLAFLPVIQISYKKENYGSDTEKFIENSWPYMLYICVAVYFALPMLFITVMYVLIWIRLKEHSNDRRIAFQADRIDTRALKMFVVIVVTFFISWAPYYACEIIWYHGKLILHDTPNFDMFSVLFDVLMFSYLVRDVTYFVSSSLNPIIYVIMSKKFREACKDYLSKSRKKLTDWTSSFMNNQTSEIDLENIS